jgi:hypothetical protein
MIKRNLYRRLEQLEACAPAAPVPEFVVVNAGTPGGVTCVWGPDGRLVWWNPPKGCKVGELLEDSESPEARSLRGMAPDEMRVVIIGARDGRDAGPTTVIGPDGRLVWLEPPEGSQAGQPIEDHLTRFVERRPRQTGRGPFASPSGTRHNRAGCEGITE